MGICIFAIASSFSVSFSLCQSSTSTYSYLQLCEALYIIFLPPLLWYYFHNSCCFLKLRLYSHHDVLLQQYLFWQRNVFSNIFWQNKNLGWWLQLLCCRLWLVNGYLLAGFFIKLQFCNTTQRDFLYNHINFFFHLRMNDKILEARWVSWAISRK